MQVHRSIDDLPQFKNAVVTIGTFDGVHLGHQKIITALKEEAKEVDGESVVITFHPHPKKVVDNSTQQYLINTLDEKIDLLQQQQIDHLVIIPFSVAFSELSANDYIKDFLVKKFSPSTIIIGYDHRFGKHRTGNFHLLEEKAEEFGYRLIEIPKHVLDEIGISSTKIRTALLHSHIETANKLLGYTFFFEGKVVEGDKIGRQLGYPTANLEYTDKDKIHLAEGVYAVYVQIGSEMKKGMLSIGKRPTLNDTVEKIEVNIFNFDGNLYGKCIKVMVKAFLRHQVKYNNLEELTAQLKKDKMASIDVL